MNSNNQNKQIDTFLWKFFGVIALLFIIFNLISGLTPNSSTDELGTSIDELGSHLEESSERMKSAVGD